MLDGADYPAESAFWRLATATVAASATQSHLLFPTLTLLRLEDGYIVSCASESGHGSRDGRRQLQLSLRPRDQQCKAAPGECRSLKLSPLCLVLVLHLSISSQTPPTVIIDTAIMEWYTFGIALFAAIGTFLFGFDTGIATTTIAHQSWVEYMGHPSNGLTGSVVAIYIAGEALGAITQTIVGDRLGRIRFMMMMCCIVTVGTVIQTASVNIGMFLAGRVLAGYAVG